MDQEEPQTPSARLKRAVKRTFGLLKKEKDSHQAAGSRPLSTGNIMVPDGIRGGIRASADSPAAERLLRDAEEGAQGHSNEELDDMPRHSDDEYDDVERLSRTAIDTKGGGATSFGSCKGSLASSGHASDYDLTMSRLWEFQRRSEENRRELHERIGNDPNFPMFLLTRPRTNSEAEPGLPATEDMTKAVQKDIRADLAVMLKMETPLAEVGKKLCDEYRADPVVGSMVALMEAADESKEAIAHATITKLGFENVPPIASPPPLTTTTSSRLHWLRHSQNTLESYAPYRSENTMPKPPIQFNHPLPVLPNAPVEEAPIVVFNNPPLSRPTPIRPGPIATRWTNEVIERTERELREKEGRLEAAEREVIDTSERNEAYARIWEWQMKQAREAEEEEEEEEEKRRR